MGIETPRISERRLQVRVLLHSPKTQDITMVNDVNIQGSLFADEPRRDTATRKSRREIHEDYDGFMEKFKPRKTTDDCYTPQPVYDAVLGWLRENADIEGREIVRPFWPGGDYEAYEYPDGCVVIDNPPFSIFSKICRFFMARGIRFFLFAPHLTLFSTRGIEWTCVVTEALITYENGAKVMTSFVSNLFGDIRIITAPDLHVSIKNVVEAAKKSVNIPTYVYPDNVVSAALLGKIAHYVKFEVRAAECRKISKLDSQKGNGIFGGGYLLSDKATARKIEAYERATALAAKRAAALAAKQVAAIVWELSEREKRIIAELE